MEEIINAFGIDWRLIVIQMVNFGLLAAVLWYFLYTPVLNILKEREEKLKQGVLDADAAALARTHADEEKQVILTNAHAEATAIVARASVHAEEKGAQIVTNAEEKAARAIVDAQAKGEEIKALAHKESEAEIAQVAILTAEKVLRDRLDS
jgi:F-type H+-transporting ATPase subunit b